MTTNLSPDFADAVRKVERANHHIAEFDAAAERYFSKRPTQVTMTPIVRKGVHGFAVGDRLGFPDKGMALYIGDAVHNLRCALDYLITACAVHNRKPTNITEFPFVKAGGRKADLKKGIFKARDADPRAAKLVWKARPYPRGNTLLVALNELDRFDKHRLIVPVESQVDVEVTTGGYNGLSIDRLKGKRRKGSTGFMPVKEGYELAVAVDMNFRSEIVFARGRPLAGKPCLPALKAMSGAVADVIEMFEDEYETIPFSRSLPRA